MNAALLKNNGFTMIEIMVVMIIIIILTGFSMVYFGGYAQRSQLESTTRDWMAHLSYARSQAVIEGTVYRINCDLDRQLYWITYQSDSSDTQGQFVNIDGPWGDEVSIDSTIKWSSLQLGTDSPLETGVVNIDFTPRGTASDDVIASFEDSDKDQQQVQLFGITGIARMVNQDSTSQSLEGTIPNAS